MKAEMKKIIYKIEENLEKEEYKKKLLKELQDACEDVVFSDVKDFVDKAFRDEIMKEFKSIAEKYDFKFKVVAYCNDYIHFELLKNKEGFWVDIYLYLRNDYISEIKSLIEKINDKDLYQIKKISDNTSHHDSCGCFLCWLYKLDKFVLNGVELKQFLKEFLKEVEVIAKNLFNNEFEREWYLSGGDTKWGGFFLKSDENKIRIFYLDKNPYIGTKTQKNIMFQKLDIRH